MAMTGTEPVSAENLKALSGMLAGVKLVWSGSSAIVNISDYESYVLLIVFADESGGSSLRNFAIVPSDYSGNVHMAHDSSNDYVSLESDGAGGLSVYVRAGISMKGGKITRVYGITGGGSS